MSTTTFHAKLKTAYKAIIEYEKLYRISFDCKKREKVIFVIKNLEQRTLTLSVFNYVDCT